MPALLRGNDPAGVLGWNSVGHPIAVSLSGFFGPCAPETVEILAFEPMPLEEAVRMAHEQHFESLTMAATMASPAP